jgi:hypothetical protein
MSFELWADLSEAVASRHLRVSARGVELARLEITPANNDHRVWKVAVPRELAPDRVLDVAFRSDEPDPPRHLAWAPPMTGLGIERLTIW